MSGDFQATGRCRLAGALWTVGLVAWLAGMGGALGGCGDDTGGPSGDAAVGQDGQVQPDAGPGPDGQVQPDASSGSDGSVTPPGPQVGGCPLFPADNMWNTPIDTAPLHDRNADYIASIGPDTNFHPDFGTVWNGAPNGIPYTVAPSDTPMVDVTFDYADESDPGPYPIPADVLIEGGPNGDGDRHVLVVHQGACVLYELFNAWPQSDGSWHAGSGAIWHLDQNEQRPDGWTSADAAGLAILPGLVRYEEAVEQGEIRHALRITLTQIQRGYVHPATHSDGRCGQDPTCPPMGLRLRLRADFDVSTFSPPIQVILEAMKTYGVVVADTGGDLFLSGAPDDRWDDDMLRELRQVTGSDLEAVYTGDVIPY